MVYDISCFICGAYQSNRYYVTDVKKYDEIENEMRETVKHEKETRKKQGKKYNNEIHKRVTKKYFELLNQLEIRDKRFDWINNFILEQ